MTRVFIDVNIPMYAGGTSHALREPSRQVSRAIAAGQLDAVTDAEVLQEILYRYLYIGEREKGFRIFDNFYRVMLGRILPVEDVDVQRARVLSEQYPALSPRDLIHLGVMLRHQIQEVVTADTGFDAVKEVRRIDPTVFSSYSPCSVRRAHDAAKAVLQAKDSKMHVSRPDPKPSFSLDPRRS